MRPRVGARTRIVTTKWPDRPHWTYPARYLGADAHGDWFGHPVGTLYTRPGMEIPGQHAMVTLVPAETADAAPSGRGYLASFHAPDSPMVVYIDVTTVPVWHGDEIWAVDLDLDVIRSRDGRLWIDDEDEFEAHQVELGYPAGVIAHARATADALFAAVEAAVPPYDGTAAAHWLDVLAELEAQPR